MWAYFQLTFECDDDMAAIKVKIIETLKAITPEGHHELDGVDIWQSCFSLGWSSYVRWQNNW